MLGNVQMDVCKNEKLLKDLQFRDESCEIYIRKFRAIIYE